MLFILFIQDWCSGS